ncbi:MAG TPA: lipid-A-disaccharide synthase N-terminal domain-containing protein [Rhodanobacteraceae bacterium]|jgi:lipid-A-disaccharide synthase-like uncharacterized protein|nr:lipid-A-disaccharide synthase N-terminal domain-containing protein [Rhodanobacteraceae bacterium]
MEHILHAITNFQLTPWKVVGFLGTAVFASRWFVQLYATRKQRKVVMPMLFWYMSVCGSVLLLAYFIFGKNDSVGIISNLFPMFVALYNVSVHMRHRQQEKAGSAAT